MGWIRRLLDAGAIVWLTIYLLFLGIATAYGFGVDRQQDHERCMARNETTSQAVIIGAESIIEASTARTDDPPDPKVIEQFRKILRQNLNNVHINC